MKTCGICGKRFVVMWPDLYVYRRGDVFLCGEDCMIVYDARQTRKKNEKGVEAELAGKLTQKQKEEVVEIAIRGGKPIEYLKKCGVNNPWASWQWIKEKLAEKDPEKYQAVIKGRMKPAERKEKESREERFAEILESVDAGRKKPAAEVTTVAEVPEITPPTPLNLQGGVDYQLKVDEMKAERKPFKVTGLETEYGRFTLGTVDGVLRFEAEGNTEISMVAEDWRKMADTLPEVLRTLGVEA